MTLANKSLLLMKASRYNYMAVNRAAEERQTHMHNSGDQKHYYKQLHTSALRGHQPALA